MAAIVFHVGKELGLLALGELGSIAKEKLGSTVTEEYSLLAGVQNEAKELAPTLALIKAVVQDAEIKQTDTEMVKLWLKTLKEIMYDADDLLDEWYTRIALSQLESTGSGSGSGSVSAFTNKVFCFLTSNCSCFEPFFFLLFGDNFLPIVVRYDIAHKIKDIRARLVKQSDEIKQLGLIPSQSLEVHSPSQTSTHHRRLTTSKDVDKIYGRGTDKDVIVRMLLGETGSSEQQEMVHVPVISIVGTGGFGKTTLAQLIYTQDTIMTAFDLRIWVCVSDPFDLERVVKEIIQQAGGSASNVFGLESLLGRLCASVKDKLFLLVLDDVWSEDNTDWIPLKRSLDAGAPGSRVLVTTRSERVANRMGSTSPQRLGPLTEADCWLLFRNIAFSGKSKKETEKLESIGRELARKCKGVPLAVKTLASSMEFENIIDQWRVVLESDTWRVLQQHKDGFLPSLMFSYLALTPSLKLCFLYCAGFPKDFRMEKDELVKQWMAQGFLESDEGDELEMIGAANFDVLAKRSLFQNFIEDSNGSIVSCCMHDLVHDFCQFLASGEARHMMVLGHHFDPHSSNVIGKKIRTLVFRKSDPFHLSLAFRELVMSHCLRTLVMSHCNIQELPGEVVGGLLHLRYLDLSWNKDLRELPKTVCDLLNLQTLKLEGCASLCQLPEGIGKLRNLRHLEIEGTGKLEYFPRSIAKLRKLRTLCKFLVSGMGGGCGIGELSNLNHLRGTLCLIGLRHVHNSDEAKRAELHEKRNLNCLKFGVMQNEFDAVEINRMEDVLESLRPNVNLVELEINNYPGFKLPSWMVSPLSKVVTLTLNDCYNCQTLPGLGHLQFLETLRLHYFLSMKHIGAEFYGVGVVTSFPKLKTLEFTGLDKLETWEIPFPKYEKVMPCLQSLVVERCPMLIGLPSLGRLESLETFKIWVLNPSECHLIVGTEFFVMSSDSSGKESNKNGTSSGGGDYVKQKTLVFPKLQELSFSSIKEIQWNFPSLYLGQKYKSVELMPQLKELELVDMDNEKVLPAFLGKLQFLECLRLGNLGSVKHVSAHLLGNSDGESTTSASSSSAVLFPRLTELELYGLPAWEEGDHTMDNNASPIAATAYIMPCLRILSIRRCPKLKVVPHYMFSQSLRKLELCDCPQLSGKPPCIPPRLVEISIDGDVGVLSTSLLPVITHPHKSTTYPNLKRVRIKKSPHLSLPERLNQLTSLE